jgi:hypothetical protein
MRMRMDRGTTNPRARQRRKRAQSPMCCVSHAFRGCALGLRKRIGSPKPNWHLQRNPEFEHRYFGLGSRATVTPEAETGGGNGSRILGGFSAWRVVFRLTLLQTARLPYVRSPGAITHAASSYAWRATAINRPHSASRRRSHARRVPSCTGAPNSSCTPVPFNGSSR